MGNKKFGGNDQGTPSLFFHPTFLHSFPAVPLHGPATTPSPPFPSPSHGTCSCSGIAASGARAKHARKHGATNLAGIWALFAFSWQSCDARTPGVLHTCGYTASLWPSSKGTATSRQTDFRGENWGHISLYSFHIVRYNSHGVAECLPPSPVQHSISFPPHHSLSNFSHTHRIVIMLALRADQQHESCNNCLSRSK